MSFVAWPLSIEFISETVILPQALGSINSKKKHKNLTKNKKSIYFGIWDPFRNKITVPNFCYDPSIIHYDVHFEK